MFKTSIIAASILFSSMALAQTGTNNGVPLVNVPYYTVVTQPSLDYTHTEKITVLTINPDGTVTFFNKEGKKIRDFDPGPEVREALQQGLETSTNCPYGGGNFLNGSAEILTTQPPKAK